jgi:acyl-CoA thioester hydrolase
VGNFRFHYPLVVRYADLDPQGHLNNACYLTYMEQARIAYIQRLGVWDGRSFLDIGIILAEARVTFRLPIVFSSQVQVGVRVARLGNKSLTMEYSLEEAGGSPQYAEGSTVLVTYDYHTQHTIPIPLAWRQVIREFEGLPE